MSAATSVVFDAQAVRTEIKIKSSWGDEFYDPEAPPTESSSVDSTGRALPQGTVMLHRLFSEAECEKLVAAAENTGCGSTDYPKHY